jgi:hypothetical protein
MQRKAPQPSSRQLQAIANSENPISIVQVNFNGGRSVKKYASSQVSTFLRRVAIAIVASGIAAQSGYAGPSNNLIVVPPTHLPELARQTGEAMLLHETIDGTTLLYIEQNQGARLAILDVTDPANIKGEGSVQLNAPGSFDFVATLGNRTELIRFRQSQEDAVLDLHKVKAPTLQRVPGLTLKGPATPLGNDGFTVSSHANADAQAATRDYQVQVVNTANSRQLKDVFDVKGVREEITKYDTGTTFLLTEDGLFLIRRPAQEMNKELRDLDYAN